MSRASDTGKAGEALAAAYLEKQGFVIIAANYKKRGGELDIVAKDGDTTVFVEVKTRSSASFGEPREYVTATKQQRVRRCAREWLYEHRGGGPCRFDVVEVMLGETEVIRHWRNAF